MWLQSAFERRVIDYLKFWLMHGGGEEGNLVAKIRSSGFTRTFVPGDYQGAIEGKTKLLCHSGRFFVHSFVLAEVFNTGLGVPVADSALELTLSVAGSFGALDVITISLVESWGNEAGETPTFIK